MADLDAMLATDLEGDEGRVRHAYLDSLGYWTIGVGHLIDERKGGGLPDHIIDALRDWDIGRAKALLDAHSPWWRTMPVNVQRAMVNMEFQLEGKFQGFVNMLAALQRRDWVDARAEGQDSTWFNQTPVRARRVLAMIKDDDNGESAIDGQDNGDRGQRAAGLPGVA